MDHHDSDTLVVGPVLDGHKFREGAFLEFWQQESPQSHFSHIGFAQGEGYSCAAA